jgi:hypothetical protein
MIRPKQPNNKSIGQQDSKKVKDFNIQYPLDE